MIQHKIGSSVIRVGNHQSNCVFKRERCSLGEITGKNSATWHFVVFLQQYHVVQPNFGLIRKSIGCCHDSKFYEASRGHNQIGLVIISFARSKAFDADSDFTLMRFDQR